MADNYINLPVEGGGGGGGGVTSLNTLTGALALVAGSNISITPLGNTLIIATIGDIASINGDTTTAQTLTVGTAGTDFAIVDNLTGNHTFNLPTASAVNRGALSSADWSTFNAKQPAGSYITALTTDVSATGPGSVVATIQPNVVTNAKLAQMPANTLKGNNTGVLANALDLTVSQVQTMLSIPTSSSPLPVTSGGTGLSAVPTNGQLLIGNTITSGYTLATLIAGSNVQITNGPGSIQIDIIAGNIDGGGATTTYSASQVINGGTA